jgi:hypothetical protein
VINSRARKLYLILVFFGLFYLLHTELKNFFQTLRKQYQKFIVHIFAYSISIFSVYNKYNIISNQL